LYIKHSDAVAAKVLTQTPMGELTTRPRRLNPPHPFSALEDVSP